MITLFHSHGIGPFDYSSLQPDDLDAIDSIARERELLLCPTIYLRRDYLFRFEQVLNAFSERRRMGELSHILGFSMEGPLLGPEGGVPRAGSWRPSADEWHLITRLGLKGLRYFVMAPDEMELDETIGEGYTYRDLLRESYDCGLRIALGHFRRDDPSRSAASIESVLEFLHDQYESSPYLVLTDHLFNDMPLTFVHAWRTKAELPCRKDQLTEFLTTPWEADSLASTLGPVPATLLEAARERRLTPAINFDGFHVDLEICRRTVEYLGADRLIAMTDDTEINMMAGEYLHQSTKNPLRYRDDGVVAAGATGPDKQIINMTSINISQSEIQVMFGSLVLEVLQFTPKSRLQDGERVYS